MIRYQFLFQICREIPSFVYLFHPNQVHLTFRKLTSILRPSFSEEGSNKRLFENLTYAAFLKYLREVSSEYKFLEKLIETLNKKIQYCTTAFIFQGNYCVGIMFCCSVYICNIQDNLRSSPLNHVFIPYQKIICTDTPLSSSPPLYYKTQNQ